VLLHRDALPELEQRVARAYEATFGRQPAFYPLDHNVEAGPIWPETAALPVSSTSEGDEAGASEE
ncbi:MAG: galactokinase, partial [Clostridia bacterium]